MEMEATKTPIKAYCNCLALEKGLDPGGHAGSFDKAIVLEMPLPWRKDIYQEAGQLPQEMLNLLALWLQRYYETGQYPQLALLIAPDPEYSRAGYRRVMFYTRDEGQITAFNKAEYHLPEAELGGLLWALFEAPENLPPYAAYLLPETQNIRDLLVCTHGTVDAACAKFGYPLYKDLRRNYAHEQLRVWRVSHFGGHVFAPTLMDMPIGHFWAYVEESQARQIAEYAGDVSNLQGHYRGWAGLKSGFLQAAERELWQRLGWDWFNWAKSGEILDQDTDNTQEASWAELRIHATEPDGTQHSYDLRVEVERHIQTISTTGYENTHNYPQYIVKA